MGRGFRWKTNGVGEGERYKSYFRCWLFNCKITKTNNVESENRCSSSYITDSLVYVLFTTNISVSMSIYVYAISNNKKMISTLHAVLKLDTLLCYSVWDHL